MVLLMASKIILQNNGKAERNMKLILATENQHKVAELKKLLTGTSWEVLSLKDFPGLSLPPETGATFQENAAIKSQYVFRATGLPSLADDSGLAVDYLGGAPGVYSARFAGEEKDAAACNEKLLCLLDGVPVSRRTARFVSVIALTTDENSTIFVEGTCEGVIAEGLSGTEGFGYDPLFYLPTLGKTMAEIPMEEKNKLSHRGKAFQQILPYLKALAGPVAEKE